MAPKNRIPTGPPDVAISIKSAGEPINVASDSKSLVVADGDVDDTRYRLLETIRLYARMQLEARGEAEAARSRHAAHYRMLAEEAASHLLRED